MPEVDGVQVLVQLGDHRFAGDLIIISGYSRSERERAMHIAATRGLRVSDHFSKPVPLNGLRSALHAIRTMRAPVAASPKRSFFRLPR
jgi:YesN/AraC family two-component response regulator